MTTRECTPLEFERALNHYHMLLRELVTGVLFTEPNARAGLAMIQELMPYNGNAGRCFREIQERTRILPTVHQPAVKRLLDAAANVLNLCIVYAPLAPERDDAVDWQFAEAAVADLKRKHGGR